MVEQYGQLTPEQTGFAYRDWIDQVSLGLIEQFDRLLVGSTLSCSFCRTE
jgi:hypothetical protein